MARVKVTVTDVTPVFKETRLKDVPIGQSFVFKHGAETPQKAIDSGNNGVRISQDNWYSHTDRQVFAMLNNAEATVYWLDLVEVKFEPVILGA